MTHLCLGEVVLEVAHLCLGVVLAHLELLLQGGQQLPLTTHLIPALGQLLLQVGQSLLDTDTVTQVTSLSNTQVTDV